MLLQTKIVEKMKKSHFVLSKSCRLWDNVEKHRGRGASHRWYRSCALHAGYLTLPIHSGCVIPRRHCFSTATMVARTRPNVTLYVHGLSCFVLDLEHRTKIGN